MYLLCLVVFAIVSSYTYAQFPYDNICDPEDPQDGVAGIYTDVRDAKGNLVYEGMANEGLVQVYQDSGVAFCKLTLRVSNMFFVMALQLFLIIWLYRLFQWVFRRSEQTSGEGFFIPTNRTDPRHRVEVVH
jgi:hypothetical protein